MKRKDGRKRENRGRENVLKKYGGKAIDLVIIFVDPQNRPKNR